MSAKKPPQEVKTAQTQLSAALGLPVEATALFGGYGLRCEGAMIAGLMPTDDPDGAVSIKLRIDKESEEFFAQAGGEHFTYQRNGKPIRMPYQSLPDEIMSDPDSLRPYALEALRAAKQALQKKNKKK